MLLVFPHAPPKKDHFLIITLFKTTNFCKVFWTSHHFPINMKKPVSSAANHSNSKYLSGELF